MTGWTLLVFNTRVNKKFFETLEFFDFESICVKAETFKNTNNNVSRETCADICILFFKHCYSTNVLCNSDPHHLAASFTGSPEGLVLKTKSPLKFLFDIDTTKKERLTASWRNSTNVTRDGRKPVRMMVTRSVVPLLSSHRYKRIR